MLCGSKTNNDLYSSYNYFLNQQHHLGAAGYPLYVIQDPTTGFSQAFLHFSAYNFQYSSNELVSSISADFHSKFDKDRSESDAQFNSDVIDQNSNASSSSSSEPESSEASPLYSLSSENSFDFKFDSDEEQFEEKTEMPTPTKQFDTKDHCSSKVEESTSSSPPENLQCCSCEAITLDAVDNPYNDNKHKKENSQLHMNKTACSLVSDTSNRIASTFIENQPKVNVTEKDNSSIETNCEASEYSDENVKDSLEHYVDSLVSMEEEDLGGKQDKSLLQTPVPTKKGLESNLDKNKSFTRKEEVRRSRKHGFVSGCSKYMDSSVHTSKSHNEFTVKIEEPEKSNGEFAFAFFNSDDKKVLEERLIRSQSELQQLNFDDEHVESDTLKVNISAKKSLNLEEETQVSKANDKLSSFDSSGNPKNNASIESPKKRQRLSSLTLDSFTNLYNNEAFLEKPILPDHSNFTTDDSIKQERDNLEGNVIFEGSLDLHSIREAYCKMTNFVMS